MAETIKKHPEGCMCLGCRGKRVCSECGCGMHNPYHRIARYALLLLILVIVFSLGVKVGEFHGEFGGSYGRHSRMMGGYESYGGGSSGYDNMMYGTPIPDDQYIEETKPASSTPAHATTTPARM